MISDLSFASNTTRCVPRKTWRERKSPAEKEEEEEKKTKIVNEQTNKKTTTTTTTTTKFQKNMLKRRYVVVCVVVVLLIRSWSNSTMCVCRVSDSPLNPHTHCRDFRGWSLVQFNYWQADPLFHCENWRPCLRCLLQSNTSFFFLILCS